MKSNIHKAGKFSKFQVVREAHHITAHHYDWWFILLRRFIVCLLHCGLGELWAVTWSQQSWHEYSKKRHTQRLSVWRISGGGGSSNIVVTGLVRWYVETGGEREGAERLQTPSCRAVRTARHDCNHWECTSPITESLTTNNCISTSSQLSSICDINLAFQPSSNWRITAACDCEYFSEENL